MSAGTNAMKSVGYFDCPGGGQVVVRGTIAYIAHMKPPHGTTIVDVSDPARPRKLAELSIPEGMHSHKVRVENDIMLVNHETYPPGPPKADFAGGLAVYDVSRPSAPRPIAEWRARGMHRFTFDGRYVYASPEIDGYLGNIVMILDLADPTRPEEVGRWWMPGQWTAGDETPAWKGRAHRCHHPHRLGGRLYVSYWHGGFVILDVADLAKPRHLSGLDWSPPFVCPTHTALPIPFSLRGRRILLVADEETRRGRSPPSCRPCRRAPPASPATTSPWTRAAFSISWTARAGCTSWSGHEADRGPDTPHRQRHPRVGANGRPRSRSSPSTPTPCCSTSATSSRCATTPRRAP